MSLLLRCLVGLVLVGAVCGASIGLVAATIDGDPAYEYDPAGVPWQDDDSVWYNYGDYFFFERGGERYPWPEG